MKIRKRILLTMSYPLHRQVTRFVAGAKQKECQWFHLTTREMENNTICYRLEHLVIPPQSVNQVEVETDGEGWNGVIKELETLHGKKPGRKMLGALRCWAHSHVNMGVNPSSQDEATWDKWLQDQIKYKIKPPLVMMIWNQRGEIFTRVYDPTLDLVFEDVPVEVEPVDTDFAYVDEALSTKLHKPPTSIMGWHDTNNWGKDSWERGPKKVEATRMSYKPCISHETRKKVVEQLRANKIDSAAKLLDSTFRDYDWTALLILLTGDYQECLDLVETYPLSTTMKSADAQRKTLAALDAVVTACDFETIDEALGLMNTLRATTNEEYALSACLRFLDRCFEKLKGPEVTT